MVSREAPSSVSGDEPFGWRPTTLQVTVRRYRCDGWPDPRDA